MGTMSKTQQIRTEVNKKAPTVQTRQHSDWCMMSVFQLRQKTEISHVIANNLVFIPAPIAHRETVMRRVCFQGL